jgi:hypothetical protein
MAWGRSVAATHDPRFDVPSGDVGEEALDGAKLGVKCCVVV